MVRKISFAEILKQVKDRDAQERQFGIDEDTTGIQSENDYIGNKDTKPDFLKKHLFTK